MDKSTQDAAFHASLDLWKRDTAVFSDPSSIIDHPGFRAITAMGNEALVPLFEELAVFPWIGICAALQVISGAILDIAEKDYGKIPVIAEAWLWWGRDNGHLPILNFERLAATLEDNTRALGTST